MPKNDSSRSAMVATIQKYYSATFIGRMGGRLPAFNTWSRPVKMPKHWVGGLLSALAVVAFVGMFAFSGEPVVSFLKGTAAEPVLLSLGMPNTIAFNLCGGYLITVFFWWLVVFLPDRQRRRMLRRNLIRQYAEFRRRAIQICVWSAGLSLNTARIEELTDPVKFKEFFHGDRWYDVANGLQESELRLNELQTEMEVFAQEVSYTLNTMVIQDDDVHGLLKRLHEQIFRLRHDATFTGDSAKYLSQFLWSVLANWSFVTGYTDDDPIKRRMEEL
jgi:hypothetical protein